MSVSCAWQVRKLTDDFSEGDTRANSIAYLIAFTMGFEVTQRVVKVIIDRRNHFALDVTYECITVSMLIPNLSLSV